ncbi:hypothetical protein TanjilG_21801 [Lupinus angustifolius]|uniref:CRM domain-containing protein n=1 Tax=Lupinus angustifolius TaxID=3871 RepID=A0A394DBN2_LUPAN|nr:PREDICTED: CRS2-associated factor 1, chloroplastic-like isoform X1 [Lupinus angustifolius]OIW20738.1 hypothetical protein TanjilG_21801 [Lupinus angustifolius]
MALNLNIPIKFPFFTPPIDPNPIDNPTHNRPSTEVRFSRWGNANAEKFEQRRRAQEEIEADIRRTRRFNAIEKITQTVTSPTTAVETFKSTGTPSTPSRSSIPGKKSKYSKPPPPPKPSPEDENPPIDVTEIPDKRFPLPPRNVKIGEDGVSYFIDGAPFEFKYSYTETPNIKPIQLRQEPVVPFGPETMRRPWTGRIPKDNRRFMIPPPPDLYSNGPRPMSREETLGEPLTEEEINGLVEATMKSTRVLYIGRDGFTHNMLENVHALWKWKRVCKIKCKGVCTVDMDNVCQQLEERTGGKIIYRKGGVVHLFRGRNYNYKNRPRFPLMLWKPVPPVYPRLVKRVPEGLTLEKATEMRRKGRDLIPICKLGKNGVYCDLVPNIREAFEECELVRINCEGLSESDYRRIASKLRDLVPCILLSLASEQIVLWRGQNWRPSSPNLGDDCKEANKINVDSANSNTLPSDVQEFKAPCLHKNLVNHLSNESHGISISSSSGDVMLSKVVVAYPTENCNLPESVVSDATSLSMRTYEVEPQPGGSTSLIVTMLGAGDNSVINIIDPHTDMLRHGSESVDVGRPSKPAVPCREVLLLLEQAVEEGRALVLDDESLDADNIHQTSKIFARSAPSGPVFKLPKKVKVQNSNKQEHSTLELKKVTIVSTKNKKEKSSNSNQTLISLDEFDFKKIERKENSDPVVRQRTARVDVLARLL